MKYRENTATTLTCPSCPVCDNSPIPINGLSDAFDFYRNTTSKFLNDLIVISHIKVTKGGTIDNIFEFIADYGYIFIGSMFLMILFYQSRLWYNFYIANLWTKYWEEIPIELRTTSPTGTNREEFKGGHKSMFLYRPKIKALFNACLFVLLIIYSIIMYLLILIGNFISLLITYLTRIIIGCVLVYLLLNAVDGIASNLSLNN